MLLLSTLLEQGCEKRGVHRYLNIKQRYGLQQASYYVHAGKPVFGTLIALLQDGVPVLGVIDQPITKERWIGVKGQGTTLNGELALLPVASTFLLPNCTAGRM